MEHGRSERSPMAPPPPQRGLLTRWLTGLGLALVWLVVAVLSLWAMAALYIDVRLSALRLPLTILYAVILVAILVKYKLHASLRCCCASDAFAWCLPGG